ncbi:MAG: Uma2 family endonuclease [Hormoscilla sp. GUM202]|nr:Uma2 family endonuclease [Hormoscilla sp. GUM202]
MLDEKLTKITEISLNMRLWTVDEYYRMANAGILQSDERVELIAGQVIKKMSPQGPPHATTIRRTKAVLENILLADALLQIQLPIRLDDRTEPEPDLAVVMGDEMRYADRHPRPDEIYLIVEVADSTLRSDRELKGNSYARAGIADYWIVDINGRQLYVLREPSPSGYQRELVLSEDETVAMLAFSERAIAVQSMLPPA